MGCADSKIVLPRDAVGTGSARQCEVVPPQGCAANVIFPSAIQYQVIRAVDAGSIFHKVSKGFREEKVKLN